MTDEEFLQNITGLEEMGDIQARNTVIKNNGGMKRLIALAAKAVLKEKRIAKKREPAFIPDNFPDPAAKERAVAWWSGQRRPDLVAAVEQQAEEFRHRNLDEQTSSWGGKWKTWYMNAVHFTKPPRFADVVEFVAPSTWLARLKVYHGLTDAPARTWNPQWGPEPGSPGSRVPPEVTRQLANLKGNGHAQTSP